MPSPSQGPLRCAPGLRKKQRNLEANRAWEPLREPGMGQPLPEIVTGISNGKISPRSLTGSSDRFVMAGDMAGDFGRGG
ncbi:MAG: hypothetical protein CMJ67_07435 [Planctomycetaceae bacterium]|nr:hypothetical protein [Planctomycetaceae bacterium]